MTRPEGMARPEDNRRGGNCGVTTVAVLAGVSFAEAWRMVGLARHRNGAKVTRRWRGTSCHWDRALALSWLGFECRNVPVPRRMTLKTWIKVSRAHPDRTYMVRTTRHAQVVKDGHVTDQNHEACPVEDYHWRNKIVTRVDEVTRKETAA